MIQTRPEGETLVGRATTAFTDYQAGDRQALDLLVETVTPLLWRTVRGTGLDTVASEDVIQTVWLALLRKADTIREPRTVVKWLLTSARREAWRVSKRLRSDLGHTGAVFGVDGEELLARTPSIAAATGSACHSGRTEASSVLTAMGLDEQRALGAVRLSLGYDTTAAEVDAAAAALVDALVPA